MATVRALFSLASRTFFFHVRRFGRVATYEYIPSCGRSHERLLGVYSLFKLAKPPGFQANHNPEGKPCIISGIYQYQDHSRSEVGSISEVTRCRRGSGGSIVAVLALSQACTHVSETSKTPASAALCAEPNGKRKQTRKSMTPDRQSTHEVYKISVHGEGGHR